MKDSPLLGLGGVDIGKNVLLVFGEETGLVTAALEKTGCALSTIARRRESTTLRAEKGGGTFPLVLAGYGSASVAGALHELVGLGSRTFILSGTCGASRHYPLGKVYILSRAVINPLGGPGAAGFHSPRDPGREVFPDPLLTGLAERSGIATIGDGQVISQDAFYGFGCIPGADGDPVYDGPETEDDQPPPGFSAFRELYRSGTSYLLDMETAFFYALCRAWKGVRGIAVKGVSNHVPFDPEDYVSEESRALDRAIEAAVILMELLEQDILGEMPGE